MQKSDIEFGTNGSMFVAPTGVRILSRCIASSEYKCTFKYFAALNLEEDKLKDVIVDMANSTTQYNGSSKSIVMQTNTEEDAYRNNLSATGSDIVAAGEIDMVNHVITSTADFTEVYIHIPNRFGSKDIKFEDSKIDFNLEDYESQPQSFKEYAKDGRDFEFNAIAIYLNISDSVNSYNSLYGIYVPSKNAESIKKYAYSDVSSIVQSGNSFGFRINLRIVEDDDNKGEAGTIQTIVDEESNSFSMGLFTDALARMNMALSDNKNMADTLRELRDEVSNLKTLCDTGATLSSLQSKVDDLSAYVDNYMLAIEDKDSLINMISNMNRNIQSILNGDAGPELNMNINLQGGDGINISTANDSYVINNVNQMYHIVDGNAFVNSDANKSLTFIPTTFSNIFPVYYRIGRLYNKDLALSINVEDNSFKFKKGQSFQFVFKNGIEWNGNGCVIKIGSKTFKIDANDIQCTKPIFEVICVNVADEERGSSAEQSDFWVRCINTTYDAALINNNKSGNNIIQVTYDEAVSLQTSGSLQLNNTYYITDYEFIPIDAATPFISINDDIKISIYLKPSDKSHFDNKAYMIITNANGIAKYAWGEYYIDKESENVEEGCHLKKGYITKLSYDSICADFDFIHCGITKSDDVKINFRTTTGEFAQSLNAGDYDSWMTSSSLKGSNCSTYGTSTLAISNSYYNSAYYPAIDLKSGNKNVKVSLQYGSTFKLPNMHISNCNNINITNCDNMLLYNDNDIVINDSNDIFIKGSNYITINSCDNLRLYNASHTTLQNAFNSWAYSSEYVSIRNANAILVDYNQGTIIEGVTGNSVVILNYYNSNSTYNRYKQKAILDNISHNCILLDNMTSLFPNIENGKLICNRYDAATIQNTTISSYEHYVWKKAIYKDDNDINIKEKAINIQITDKNISDLL